MTERMADLLRYLPELSPTRLKKNIQRLWRREINPPPERGIYTSPEQYQVISKKIGQVETRQEPKQVAYSHFTNSLLVSCMEGRTLQAFSIRDKGLSLTNELTFPDQCVEVTAWNNLAFVTTTNFERPPRSTHNYLHVIDLDNWGVVSSIETEGNWSKLIAVHPDGEEVLVSNWHSHNISVIDIEDVQKPQVKQIIEWGEAPRGIAITGDGKTAILTGFYSGDIGVLEKQRNGEWNLVYTSPPFDQPHYPGNPRHLLIDDEKQLAYISNLGRNLVHIWSLPKRKFIDNLPVGKSPNSITFVDDEKKVLAVSCRGSNSVYFLDVKDRKTIGVSERTGDKPTGLCSLPGGEIAVTCFDDKTLSRYKMATS